MTKYSILFIITRILDMISTLLNIKGNDWSVELNPIVRYIGTRGLFIPYQLALIVITISLVSKIRFKRAFYISFSVISLIAVAINLYSLTL